MSNEVADLVNDGLAALFFCSSGPEGDGEAKATDHAVHDVATGALPHGLASLDIEGIAHPARELCLPFNPQLLYEIFTTEVLEAFNGLGCCGLLH